MTSIARDAGSIGLELLEDKLRESSIASTPGDPSTERTSGENDHIQEAILLMRQALTCLDAGGAGIAAAHLDMAIQMASSSAKSLDSEHYPSK